jgi:hypothetical protein
MKNLLDIDYGAYIALQWSMIADRWSLHKDLPELVYSHDLTTYVLANEAIMVKLVL